MTILRPILEVDYPQHLMKLHEINKYSWNIFRFFFLEPIAITSTKA